ncbi:MAG TPA: DUF1028 domain-containing protein [Gaiellaceae bacterium]|nr:DUF1028 domain-containing protein [Gaiellaceae bacterium]
MASRARAVTYSIVARDAETGELGVAVQSRAFRAGSGVGWALPGVGAVASQAFSEPSYGPLGLELLQAGKTPEQALAGLVAADPESAVRQVAVVDAEGRTAVHTGAECIREAGHRTGDGYSVQANMMRSADVWPAMAKAFEAASGSLARRLLASLEAAEAAGGDWRGQQAAGLLVVAADDKPWERISDLRVDDHAQPLRELRRLLDLEEAYRALTRSDERAAAARAGGLSEVDVRWAEIIDAGQAGDVARARDLLAPLLVEEPRWADFVRALAARGLVPDADELLR